MWPNPQEAVTSVTFTEEILHGKLHFLCSESKNHLKIDKSSRALLKCPFSIVSFNISFDHSTREAYSQIPRHRHWKGTI